MNTKDLRALFNMFTQIVETNPAPMAEGYLYYLNMDMDIQCPEGCVGWCSMPAELNDGTTGLAIEYTFLDDEGDAYTTLQILRPDYDTGRMVREMPLRPHAKR